MQEGIGIGGELPAVDVAVNGYGVAFDRSGCLNRGFHGTLCLTVG